MSEAKHQIDKSKEYIHLTNGMPFDFYSEFTTAFGLHDRKIQKMHPKVSTGALSNSHGDWYEWTIAIEAWNLAFKNKTKY